MRDYWISQAIRICGSQKELARRMRVKPGKISYLLNQAKEISLEDALLIEEATGGVITCSYLMGHLNPKIKRKLEESCENKKLSVSERTMMGVAFEKEIGNRKGKRSDLQSWENFPHVKGRTEELAALKVGFKNYKTYQQAKRVVQSGSSLLIQAMDEERISVSIAAKLAKLSYAEQQDLLQLTKKEVIAHLRKSHRKTYLLTHDHLNNFLLNCLHVYFYLKKSLERTS